MYKKIQKFTLIVLVLLIVMLIGVVLPAMAASPGARVSQGGSQLEIIAEALVIAAFMATAANRLVAGLVEPLFAKFKWDKFYLMYIAWGAGGVLVWVSHVNIFGAYIPDPLIGQILTALVSGGGANFIHDLFDKPG